MPSINPITTTLGRAAILTAIGLADTLTVTDVQLSDTNQAVTVATTALTNVVATLTATGSVRVAGSGHALHLVLKDDTTAAYDVRALALRLSDGTFLMVYSQAGLIAVKAAGSSLHLAIDVTVDADTAATLDFGDTDYLLPAASDTAPGIIELATNAEVQAGLDTLRAVTPAGLASCTATATRAGVVELATDAEVQTGTDTARAVTPAGLNACTATETRRGVIEIANTAETLVGADDARALTAAKLAYWYVNYWLITNHVLAADLQVQDFTAQDVDVGTLAFTTPKSREVPIPLTGGDYDRTEFDRNSTGALVSLGADKSWHRSINEFLPRKGTFKRMRAAVDVAGAAGVALHVTLQKRTMNPASASNPSPSDIVDLTRTADAVAIVDSGTVTHAFDRATEEWYLEVVSSSNGASGDAVFWVSLTILDNGEL